LETKRKRMEAASVVQDDLTKTISQHLDRHLVFPMLEFLSGLNLYPEEDLLQAKLSLIAKTNMVDYAITYHKQLNGTEEVPEDLATRRQAVIDRLEALSDDAKQIIDIFQNKDIVARFRTDKNFNLQYLKENHNFDPAWLDSLYKYAKFQFDCGDYAGASEMLYHFRILSTDPEKNLSALWGKLASEILLSSWEIAFEDLTSLKQHIDQKQSLNAPPLEILQQRTWFIHWGLFVFFNHPKGRDMILDILLQPAYKQTIQTTCPHMLRYLTIAVILNKRRREALKELVSLIQQESYTYHDPVTDFLQSLYVNFDFDGAQKTLLECEKVLANDFFLEIFLQDFIVNARLFIFETYCKIHQRIDIGMLAQKLNMERDDAEKWIVDLIRNAQLDGKIDSEKNSVNITQKNQNIYQQVIEKTKPLAFRTYVLSTSIDKKNAQVTQQKSQQKSFNPRTNKKLTQRKDKQ